MRLYRFRLQARISGQAPKEVAERAYRDSMVAEVVMPWLSSDAGRSQCCPCYVDLIGNLFYQAPEECNFLSGLMSLYFSLPVSKPLQNHKEHMKKVLDRLFQAGL